MARTRTKGKPSERLSERNASIYDDFAAGRKSVAELAREWKVVESRIRAIVDSERKLRGIEKESKA